MVLQRLNAAILAGAQFPVKAALAHPRRALLIASVAAVAKPILTIRFAAFTYLASEYPKTTALCAVVFYANQEPKYRSKN